MRNYGIKQPVVCCIINRATTITIIWKSDSDSKSVDFHRQFFSGFLSQQVGTHFQECVLLSEESFLGRMPGVQIQAYHFPVGPNVLTNSLFMSQDYSN